MASQASPSRSIRSSGRKAENLSQESFFRHDSISPPDPDHSNGRMGRVRPNVSAILLRG